MTQRIPITVLFLLLAALFPAGAHPAGTPQPVGGEFQVNTYTTNSQSLPAVAVDADGDFVVVWSSYGSGGSDASSSSVQGQRYDSTGAAAGVEFQVNTYTTHRQRQPGVAADAGGDFVVVWESYGSGGSDGSETSVQGQRYDSTGTAIGDEFQVNTYTTNGQGLAAVSAAAGGGFVAVWASLGSSGSDSSSNSVQGQRFAGFAGPSIFCDGFESGDTSAWSSTVP